MRRAVNLDWQDLPLRRLLEERYRLPVYVANDCQIAALAEYTFGDGRASDNLVVIKAGHGIGDRVAGRGHGHPVDLEGGIARACHQPSGGGCRGPGQVGQAFLARRLARLDLEAVQRTFSAFQHDLCAARAIGNIGGHPAARRVDRPGDIGQGRPAGNRDIDLGPRRIGSEGTARHRAEAQRQRARSDRAAGRGIGRGGQGLAAGQAGHFQRIGGVDADRPARHGGHAGVGNGRGVRDRVSY